MPQRNHYIPGIETLELPEKRQSVGRIHGYLRECIFDGRVPPDTTLSQVALAKQLGVSRTPLREVLRMLQEEGLVQSEPNQRMRVVGFDASELDAIYASRIVLECLAVSMSVDDLRARHLPQAKRALATMRKSAKKRDLNGWFSAHAQFHDLFAQSAAEPLRTQLRSLTERSARYIRIAQASNPTGWEDIGDIDHQAMLEAAVDGDEATVVSLTAHHLKRTALLVLTDCAPDYIPKAVPAALRQIHVRRKHKPATRLALAAGT